MTKRKKSSHFVMRIIHVYKTTHYKGTQTCQTKNRDIVSGNLALLFDTTILVCYQNFLHTWTDGLALVVNN
jgi:hypothetical protein